MLNQAIWGYNNKRWPSLWRQESQQQQNSHMLRKQIVFREGGEPQGSRRKTIKNKAVSQKKFQFNLKTSRKSQELKACEIKVTKDDNNWELKGSTVWDRLVSRVGQGMGKKFVVAPQKTCHESARKRTGERDIDEN